MADLGKLTDARFEVIDNVLNNGKIKKRINKISNRIYDECYAFTNRAEDRFQILCRKQPISKRCNRFADRSRKIKYIKVNFTKNNAKTAKYGLNRAANQGDDNIQNCKKTLEDAREILDRSRRGLQGLR